MKAWRLAGSRGAEQLAQAGQMDMVMEVVFADTERTRLYLSFRGCEEMADVDSRLIVTQRT